jgi:hypothetical protein
MRFRPNWDSYLIATLGRCPSPHPVLTTYPIGYELPDKRPRDRRPTLLCPSKVRLGPDGPTDPPQCLFSRQPQKLRPAGRAESPQCPFTRKGVATGVMDGAASLNPFRTLCPRRHPAVRRRGRAAADGPRVPGGGAGADPLAAVGRGLQLLARRPAGAVPLRPPPPTPLLRGGDHHGRTVGSRRLVFRVTGLQGR